jgi:hypothetical protein
VRRLLLAAILLASLGLSGFSVRAVTRGFPPPDASATALVIAWLCWPFLMAALLSGLFHRRAAVLVALLFAVVAAGVVGATLYDSAASQALVARQEAATAVLPGEDADRGPGGMRKAGADMGSFVTDLFGMAVVVIVPPIQAVGVVLAFGLGLALSLWRRARSQAVETG